MAQSSAQFNPCVCVAARGSNRLNR